MAPPPVQRLICRVLSRVADKVADIVAPADIAEAVCQVGEDACAWRLLSLHAARVEARDNLPDAHQMVTRRSATARRGDAALEEAWREAVRYARENVGLPEDLVERDAVSVLLLPLVIRVGAKDN